MIRIFLTRTSNHKERFYLLTINKNLFGEYILERVYGNINNKAPTGNKKNIYDDINISIKILHKILMSKLNKKYKIISIKNN